MASVKFLKVSVCQGLLDQASCCGAWGGVKLILLFIIFSSSDSGHLNAWVSNKNEPSHLKGDPIRLIFPQVERTKTVQMVPALLYYAHQHHPEGLPPYPSALSRHVPEYVC